MIFIRTLKPVWPLIWLFSEVFYGGVVFADSLDEAEQAFQRGDYVMAARIVQPLARQGVAQAQYYLGGMYRAGRGVAQDDEKAVYWYQLAARQGAVRAQVDLGGMYLVAGDYGQAMKWYQLASEQGDPQAWILLASMYVTGQEDVAQNLVYAHMWVSLAAATGDQKAIKARDQVASLMTPEQIARSQVLAERCQQQDYKGC